MFGKKVNAPIMFDTVAKCYREIGGLIRFDSNEYTFFEGVK